MKHQLSNLFLGWWGTISFFATFGHLVMNTATYFGARGQLKQLLPARREAPRSIPAGSARERLAPFRHNVRLRLNRGEPFDAIAADLAATHTASLADAEAFVREVEAETRAAVATV